MGSRWTPVSRRALLGVLSVGAVLVPAVAIAYLGAVSYREDRGIVAAQVEEHFRAASDMARGVEGELSEALEKAARAWEHGGKAALSAAEATDGAGPRAFAIAPSGELVHPAPDPFRAPGRRQEPIRTGVEQPCLGALAACMKQLRAAELRVQQLDSARQLEVGECSIESGECAPTARGIAEARRLYRSLVTFEDTGAEALLGLARIDAAVRNAEGASAMFDRLAAEYGDRATIDGIPYDLLAALGRAEVARDGAALLAILDRLLRREIDAPSAALSAMAAHIAARVGELGDAADREQLAALQRKLDLAREEARFAATFAEEVEELFHTAGSEPRGRPSLLSPQRSMVFRRTADGGVIGLVVERTELDRAAERALARSRGLGPNVRARVHGLGEPAKQSERRMATAAFGPVLSHLTLSLVIDAALPDPLDEVVERRGRRHMLITGSLMLLLAIGLVATIRGAARERELARLKSEFVSTVSHELKTPLTSIRMFAEMLQQGVAGSDREREARYHEIIVKESERLGLLIANLLDYSQIERGTRRYARAEHPLAGIAREAVETFGRFREGERQEVSIEIGSGADSLSVWADREVVVQSILNLLSNAAKYGGGKPISVLVRQRGDGRGSVSVVDRGPGIPAAEHERIFREFYRAPSAYKSQVEGTGLGLALVKRHVEAHGGLVELESAEGAGATFSIVLPGIAA